MSGRTARALSPSSPSGNLTRNVTLMSVSRLPLSSLIFSAPAVTSKDSGSARRDVTMSTSTAVQPAIAASSSSTGVKSVSAVDPVPIVMCPPRTFVTVYLLFSMRSMLTWRCVSSAIRSTMPDGAGSGFVGAHEDEADQDQRTAGELRVGGHLAEQQPGEQRREQDLGHADE